MSESFHTIVVRLDRPSRRKQSLLDDCFQSYARGFQALLDIKEPEIKQLVVSCQCPTLQALHKLFTPADRACLKAYGLEPFTDSLFQDIAMMWESHLALRQNRQRASYPLIHLSPQSWQEKAIGLIASLSASPPAQLNQLSLASPPATGFRAAAWPSGYPLDVLAQKLRRSCEAINRIKSIYFGRHAANRDFCLLYQPATGRFYAKLYLLNRQRAKVWQSQSGTGTASSSPLYHMTKDHDMLALPKSGDRFVVFPLNMGANQRESLLAAWADPTLLRTARLCRTGRETDLHIQMRRVDPGESFGAPLHWIGLVRSSEAAVALSLCRKDGSVIRQELLDLEPAQLVLAVRRLARQTHAQVILPELTHHGDSLYQMSEDGQTVAARIGKPAWLELVEKLKSALAKSGLTQPILVSPYHLYQTCPRCGNNRKANRALQTLLVCNHCGFSQEVSIAASFNLVAKFLSYRQDSPPEKVVRDFSRGTRPFHRAVP